MATRLRAGCDAEQRPKAFSRALDLLDVFSSHPRPHFHCADKCVSIVQGLLEGSIISFAASRRHVGLDKRHITEPQRGGTRAASGEGTCVAVDDGYA